MIVLAVPEIHLNSLLACLEIPHIPARARGHPRVLTNMTYPSDCRGTRATPDVGFGQLPASHPDAEGE